MMKYIKMDVQIYLYMSVSIENCKVKTEVLYSHSSKLIKANKSKEKENVCE